ncbi:MAG: 3-isopropylmalate dehydrogenase [Eubacteriales bacterium]
MNKTTVGGGKMLKVALIPGDGVGPEVITSAIRVLDRVAEKNGHKILYEYACAGGEAIDREGIPLPEETIDICKKSDAVLLGAVGGPKWDSLPGELRPERAILGLRSSLCLYANLRPAVLHEPLKSFSPLAESVREKGIDMLFVRELTGGIYFGKRGRKATKNKVFAFDTESYTDKEIKRVGKMAFELARARKKRLTSVDKANVLETSRLWRETLMEMSGDYPEVEFESMYIDNAAMQLIKNPSRFDVIVTSNLFGDILTDEASAIIGSIGLSPSASVGEGRFGLYEPIHGSAPDIAGKGIANPVGTVLSAAMMLRFTFGLEKEALEIENAVASALESGARTKDIAERNMNNNFISTNDMTEKILSYL